MSKPNRRRFLIATGAAAGAAGLAAGFWWRHRPQRDERVAHVGPPAPRDAAFPNPLRLPGAEGMYGVLDVSGPLTIVAKPVTHALLPDKPVAMYAYEVEHQGRTYLNPLLKVHSGATFRAVFWNALEEPSIIHWHGFKVDSNNDGHPHYAVPGGATYDYQFTVANRAATYWYHPHPHHLTGKQVYLGLAGLFVVEDDEELALQKALDLRFGETDVPLVLQDRTFDAGGWPVFGPGPDQRSHGYLGTEVLVNATSRPHFDAATRLYRFRILNGSNARIYRLAFRHGERLLDYQVIGGDGGLLDRPYAVKEAFLSPAERMDVLLDLRSAQPGDSLTLVSLPFDPMHHEAGGTDSAGRGEHAQHGAHGGGAPQDRYTPDGTEIDLLKIHVRRRIAYERGVPRALSRMAPPPAATAAPRTITLDQSQGVWRINGLTYDAMATPIVVKRGTTEVWEIRNASRSMPHPMHIHGFQFRVLDRRDSPQQVSHLALNAQGLLASDLGWKDTVLSWPGETVRIVTDFSHSFLGDQVYMVHCHNLEHEDGGMMLNLKVAA